jgi:hypothetical protein
VRWFRDSNDVSHAFEHKFNGTAAQTNYENLYEHKFYTDRRTGRLVENPNGYEWNKKVSIIFCLVLIINGFNGHYIIIEEHAKKLVLSHFCQPCRDNELSVSKTCYQKWHACSMMLVLSLYC